MQRYLWPGYEVQLLGGLQRQQNSAQFCDTLLHTEGISVPTHSCVLAALSPYLSQKLSASPSPPSGQKRQLQLQPVKAQTLLKLVGLLYSGVLEVKGNKEKSDVLAAAHQFGITDLVQEQRDGDMKDLQETRQTRGSCRESQGSLKIQDAHVEAERARKEEKNSPFRKKSYVSVGTQTVTVAENSVNSSALLSGQTEPPNPEPASSVAQSPDVCIAVPHQNITPYPTIPSDGESTFGRSSGSVTNPTSTSTLSTDTGTFPVSLNDSSASETQEDCYQESPESGENIRWLAKERTGLEGGKTNSTTAENERNAEQPGRVCSDKIKRKENATEKKHSHGNAGVKDITKMKAMMETTQISIKVKLRRRTKGEVWEVVNMQGPDETLSVLTSLSQDCTNYKKPQTDAEEVQPPPSPAYPCPTQKPETQSLPSAVANSSKQHTTSDSQSFSSSSFTPNHISELELVPLPQPQGSVDESDEQIEKLLEDIMMGLNILPSLERHCKKSEPSHNEVPTVCQVPVTENDTGQGHMHAVASAAACVFYQELETQSDHTSADTALNQPSCTSFPTVQPDGLIQQQQRRYDSPVRSLGQIDGLSCQGLPPSKSQNSLYPEASTSSVLPSAFFSSKQKLHHPAFQPPSSQDDQQILEFLPLSNGNGTQSDHTFSLPCMDDLRLPRRLSPLEPSTSATKRQPLLNNSAKSEREIQQQPSLPRRPWLSENPGSLQFPFSGITCRDDKSMSLTPDPNCSQPSKQGQEGKGLNTKNGGTGAESCTMNNLKERGVKSAAELKSYSSRMKESFKYKHDNTTAGRRKKRRTNHQQDATGSCSAYKDLKVSDGTKSCSVSLSSNNVLVKERGIAIRSSNMPCVLVGKPSEMSTTIESGEEKPKESSSTKQTQIRTRGFVKKSQEATSNTTPFENSSVFKPVVRRAQLVNQQGVLLPKRKRGRPRKIKLVEGSAVSVPAVVENKRDSGDGEQTDRDLTKKEEDKKTEKRGRKRRRNKSEVEVIPPKKTVSAECAGNAEEASDRKPGTPKQQQTVTLMEFQKLIKRQHSKAMKSKESQEAHKPVRDIESDARTNTDGILEESAKDKEVDIKDRTNTEENHEGSNTEVDKNHSHLFNTSAAQCCTSHQHDTNSSTSEKSSLKGDEEHPLSFEAVEEDATKMTTKSEQLVRSIDEEMLCGADSDILLPQQKAALDCKLHPQTLERTGPPLSDADGISRTSGCDEKGKEEDEEVDILIYSPEKALPSRECEDGLNNNMDMTPNEDEEEDVIEIDVTGDEAE